MVINTHDVIDFGNFPNPQSVQEAVRPGSGRDVINRSYPGVGNIAFRSELFPHIHLMNIHWRTEERVELVDKTSSDTININFHLAGNLDTRFHGIRHELQMKTGRHNLIYSPEGGFINRIPNKSTLEMFHLSLDKTFFTEAIGIEDSWSERLAENVAQYRPFAGVEGTAQITPEMLGLIREIKLAESFGPMRNLLVQSKILELLALQLGQFRPLINTNQQFRPDEIEKLHHLKGFLDINFLAELSLTQLSRICLLNEFKVKKGFKAVFGMTVFAYVRKLRMEYAEKLLLDSALTVEEVSDRLGYLHAQHFSTAFKKFTGISPSHIQSKTTSQFASSRPAKL